MAKASLSVSQILAGSLVLKLDVPEPEISERLRSGLVEWNTVETGEPSIERPSIAMCSA